MRKCDNQKRLCYSYLMAVFFASGLLNPAPGLSAPFDSGSTGADGAFAPTSDTVLAVPPSGVFNFTTVNIPAGVTVTFTPNATNTPVTMLASGDVTINGTIGVNGQDGTSVDSPTLTLPIGSGGAGGPGGFAGGAGGLSAPFNGGVAASPGDGLGPGGAIFSRCGGSFGTSAGGCQGGAPYGTITLLPLIGGSGGAGGGAQGSQAFGCTNGCNGGGGGGGGGAILIASSGTIMVNGSITSTGGSGGNGYQPGGPGSGGGIRLITNTIAGTGTITALAGSMNPLGFTASNGRIRLEANAFSFSGTVTPGPTISTPGLVNLSPLPTLSITAVAGVTAPTSPRGLYDSPDITLPSSTSSPLTVNLAASNIPVGTFITVSRKYRNIISGTGNFGGSLSGTFASSTATVNVSFSDRQPMMLRAEATFEVQTASNPFPTYAEGEKVKKIRVAAVLGGKSSVFLITETGREIPWN